MVGNLGAATDQIRIQKRVENMNDEGLGQHIKLKVEVNKKEY